MLVSGCTEQPESCKPGRARLSLVSLGVVEDAVALPAQVPTVVTQNEGLRLPVIMVVT